MTPSGQLVFSYHLAEGKLAQGDDVYVEMGGESGVASFDGFAAKSGVGLKGGRRVSWGKKIENGTAKKD